MAPVPNARMSSYLGASSSEMCQDEIPVLA